ncbi:TPA: hypothetical protein QC364_000756 [Bacillus cereus]|nr:hypothetical protein [Bacillus cereus]
MKNFTIINVKGMEGFEALTQEKVSVENLLVQKCNEQQSKISGFIETRREVLHTEFDREACREYLELVPSYVQGNEFFRKMMRVIMQKISRDFVREGWVDSLVENAKMKLEIFGGDITKAIDHYEAYYTCGKLCPVAQTWRERLEELEKGMVIYNEPNPSKAV